MFDIAEDQRDLPLLRQLSVFLPNRVGALMGATRALEALGLRICSLAISDAVDHAVARLMLDRPELGKAALESAGHAVVETELLAVVLPEGDRDGIRRVLARLLMAEINVHYVYTFLTGDRGRAVMALLPENLATAARVLTDGGFELVGQEALE